MAQSKIYKILDKLVPKKNYFAEHKKLLWENSSPSSSFSEQSVSVDLTGCEKIEVICTLDSSIPNVSQIISTHVLNYESSSLHSRVDGAMRVRTIKPSNSSVQFGAGYFNGSVNNNALTPFKIYGIYKIGTL